MKVSEVFRSKYLKASDLQGKTITATIKSAEWEEIGEAQESKPVIYFVNHQRGLVLNITNATVLARGLGDEMNEWSGRAIQLYSEPVFFQGKQVDGLRVKVPKPPPGESDPPTSGLPRSPAPAATGAGEDLDDDLPF